MRTIIFLFITFTLIQTDLRAQQISHPTVDSLMTRWVEIYNSDDADALGTYYAEDIVVASDTLASTVQGKSAAIEGSSKRMQVTKNLKVHPLYSYLEGYVAYQIGRWTITDPSGKLTGVHNFIWHKIDGNWKLRYAYYLHDPVGRIEEFKKMLNN